MNPNLEKEVKGAQLYVRKNAKIYNVTEEQYAGFKAELENISGWTWSATAKAYVNRDVQDIEHVIVREITLWRTATVEIPLTVKKGDIVLTKKGIYKNNEEEQEQEELLPNVTFKVYCDNVDKFIQDVTPYEDRTQITFTDNIEDAKSYTTDKDGKIVIEDLFAGRVNEKGEKEGYTYKLVEYDGGENSYYIDPLKIENAESSYQLEGKDETQDTGITTGHKEFGGKTYCTVENVTVYYDDDAGTPGQGKTVETRILIEDDRTSGDLTIEKVDETFPDQVKLQGAEFKIKLERSEHLNENGEEDSDHDLNQSNLWLKAIPKTTKLIEGEEKEVYDYSNLLHDQYLVSEEEAGTFVTGSDGKINILCIINGKYKIYETKTSRGYRKESQWEYGKDPEHPDWVYYGEVDISTNNNHIEKQLKNRKIVKLEGNIWEDTLIGEKDPGEFFGLFEDIDENGKHIYNDTSTMKEDGHDGHNDLLLTDEEDKVIVNLWIKQKYSSGNKKENEYGITQEDGTNKPNATTALSLITGEWSIYRKGQQIGDEYMEGSTGKWSKLNNTTELWEELKADESDIYYWDLTDAYIEFIYNNKKYVCVDPFVMMGSDEIERNNRQYSLPRNSKAIEKDLNREELDDRNLTGINPDVQYYGSAITKENATWKTDSTGNYTEEGPLEILEHTWENDKYKFDELGLTGYYNPDEYTVENINLGLWRKEEPEYKVQETLMYSKIIMNNNIYTYNYTYNVVDENKQNHEYVTGLVPTTNQEVGKMVYGASVYPSDIAYTNEAIKNGINGMEMYVVYRIDIYNPQVHVGQYKRNIYDEARLYVTELKDNFDGYKYEVSNNTHDGDEANWKGSKYFDLWNSDGTYNLVKENERTFEKEEETEIANDKGKLSDGIKPGTTEQVYIQFKVTKTFLDDVLKNQVETFDENYMAATQVQATAHHAYTREDNSWTGKDKKLPENTYIYDNFGGINGNRPQDEIDTNERQSELESAPSKEENQGKNLEERYDKRRTFLHRSVDDTRMAGALGVIFKLSEERTISGTVFEDMDNKEGENLGNGILDQNTEKNRASGVKVQLINLGIGEDESVKETPATLFQKDKNAENGYTLPLPLAEAITDENGKYELRGVVPGLYKLVFTYPDGKTEMIIPNSNNENITPNNYKSTILNTTNPEPKDLIRAAEEASEKKKEIIESRDTYYKALKGKEYGTALVGELEKLQKQIEWYKHLYFNDSEIEYNLATDDYNMRSNYKDYKYTTPYDGNGINVTGPQLDEPGKAIAEAFDPMESATPYFNISIENDIQDEREVKGEKNNSILNDITQNNNKNEEGQYDRNLSNLTDYSGVEQNAYYGVRFLYNRFDFGLIKTTETKLTIDKIISDVKLTTSSGTTLVQGSPREALNYVTALDELKEGSQYVRVEMPLDNIYGTALETTYKITIANNSDKDYTSSNYFRYGDTNGAELAKTTVLEVVDKMDSDYDLLNDTLLEKVHHGDDNIEESNVTVTAKADELSLTEWSGITTGEFTEVEYKASGIFRDDMDLTYNNGAKITKIQLDKCQALKTEYVNDWPKIIDTRLVVTPDTGEDRSSTYYVIGIMSLLILGAGIVIIKGIVSKKQD